MIRVNELTVKPICVKAKHKHLAQIICKSEIQKHPEKWNFVKRL